MLPRNPQGPGLRACRAGCQVLSSWGPTLNRAAMQALKAAQAVSSYPGGLDIRIRCPWKSGYATF